MDLQGNIVYLDDNEYQVLDSEIIEDSQPVEEDIEDNEYVITAEDIKYLIELINQILNSMSNYYAKTLPMYSNNSFFELYLNSNTQKINELNYMKSIIELLKQSVDIDNNEEDTKYDIKSSDLLNDISQLLNKKEKNKDQEIQIKKSQEEINFIIIKNLINRFLKLYFKEKKSTLNERAKSDIEKTHGYYYWDKKRIARHLTTMEYTKILNDKYDMQYAQGKNESVPLAFYFDLSGSMKNYTLILSQISYYLLRNKIKVLIGFNEQIYYQINEINNKVTLKELTYFFENYYNTLNTNIKYLNIHENIDTYLIQKLCEKCVVFSDNDSYSEVCELSKKCDVYLLYAANYFKQDDDNFKGCVFNINNEEDLFNALRNISKTNFQVLKQKSKKLKRRSKND